LKIYIVVDTHGRGKQAIQQVFTNRIKALKYIEKWEALGQTGLEVYMFETGGRK